MDFFFQTLTTLKIKKCYHLQYHHLSLFTGVVTSQRGSALEAATAATAALGSARGKKNCPQQSDTNTMSNQDEIRYCHRFSYVFLKFLLFFYAIVWWVSKETMNVCLTGSSHFLETLLNRRDGNTVVTVVYLRVCACVFHYNCLATL